MRKWKKSQTLFLIMFHFLYLFVFYKTGFGQENNICVKLVKSARKSGLLSVSKSLLTSAKIAGIDQKKLVFEEAKILFEEKYVFEALELLECNFDVFTFLNVFFSFFNKKNTF